MWAEVAVSRLVVGVVSGRTFVIDEWVSRLCFVGSYSVQLPKRCDRVQCGLCFKLLFVQFDDAFTIVGICIVKHGCASGTPGMPSQKRFSSTVTSRTAH